jgi:F-type H+-transporting ATPase subunit a
LALRLFANIFAGEVLVSTILSLVVLVMPLPFMLFELFVALIQALVFTLLSTTYISMAIKEE